MALFKSYYRFARVALLGVALAAVLGYAWYTEQKTVADWHSGELVVLVVESASSADSQFEQELARLFADHLHVRLKTVPVAISKIPDELTRQQAHLAAAGLRSNESMDGLKFGPSYQTVREQFVFNRDQPMPRKVADLLNKRIAVVAGSAQEAVLREVQRTQPLLQWESRDRNSVENLLSDVANGNLDFTLVNEEQLSLARNFYGKLAAANLVLAEPSRLAWAFTPTADQELLAEANKFFASIRADGTLHRLLDRYYGYNERLEPIDAAAFITQIRTTLPRYRALFEEASRWTGMEWQLLAALAYQESHWNPLATSPTNVRGMMMLTGDTADRMNVSNRLDARQSILAGAQYLTLIKDMLPLRIEEPDRTWMALAAYNQGYGHLEDARILTQRMGMDSDRWVAVKKWMPLLNQPEYFEQLKHGYARGGEAVILVENIRMYYDMLKRLDSQMTAPRLPPTPYYQLLEARSRL
jgi:membrane-bound lytic murein transglycosylase F